MRQSDDDLMTRVRYSFTVEILGISKKNPFSLRVPLDQQGARFHIRSVNCIKKDPTITIELCKASLMYDNRDSYDFIPNSWAARKKVNSPAQG